MSQINVNTIRNRTGGPPNLDKGAVVTGILTCTGNVSVGGTLTYEDVTNIDSTGIVTAKSGIFVGNPVSPGIGATINPNGNAVFAGIVSATQYIGDGSQLEGIDATAIQTGNTSVQTVDTGSDGHVKMTTEGGERVRVGPAGQIGLGGANYGTSGQVITSAGTGAAPTWSAIPAGGNQVDLVADGAIAANKPCIIKTTGKVSEVKTTSGLITTLSAASAQKAFNEVATLYKENSNRIAYDPDDNLILVTFVANSNPEYPTSRLAVPDASGGDFTLLGSLTQITSHSGGGDGDQNVTYLSSRRFVYVYTRADNNQSRIAVGTVSGSGTSRTISWSADQSLDGSSTGGRYSSFQIQKIGTNRVAVFATARNSSSRWADDKPGVMILDISGSTSTYRSSAQLSNDGSASNWWRSSLAYNSTDDLCLASWWRSSSILNARAFKVDSGTSATITMSSTEAGAATTNDRQTMIWHPTQNKFLLAYNQGNASSINTIIYTVNSSTLAITATSPATISSSAGKSNEGMFLVVSARNTIHLKTITNNREPYTYVDNSFDGSTFNIDVQGNTGTSYNGYMDGAVRSISASGSPTEDIISLYGTTSAVTDKRPIGMVNKVVTTTSNLTHQDHYIGFADQAYSDGQTATILTYGNNVNTLSGLTAGTKYYVQANGSLATTADSTLTGYFVPNTPVAGTALSATKLLIRDPTVRV